jgi:uncharacterized protein (TIGR00730 family)
MAEFVEGFEVMAPVKRGVSIFGSARTAPSDPYYKAAEQTARLLAREDFAVITGGGPGIMEAANKGAYEAGGESIGLNITLPQEQEANRYQTISLDFHYFYARKVMFTKYATAFVCFPGGYGTLDETFETLTLIQTLKVEAFPIVLYGSEYWGGLAEWIGRTLKPCYIDPEDTRIFRVVDSPREAVKAPATGGAPSAPGRRTPSRSANRSNNEPCAWLNAPSSPKCSDPPHRRPGRFRARLAAGSRSWPASSAEPDHLRDSCVQGRIGGGGFARRVVGYRARLARLVCRRPGSAG